jgi:hypothetical protein
VKHATFARPNHRSGNSLTTRIPGSFTLLSGLAPQKPQRRLIELLDLFIDRRVRARFQDHQLGAANATLQRIRETRRCHLIRASERDLRRRFDPSNLGRHVMGDHSIRLPQERRDRLRWPTSYKTRQGLDVLRLSGIQLRRKAPGKIAAITISATLPSAFAITCQPSITVLMKGSVFVQLLCGDNDCTLSGCLAVSHIPTAKPTDKPETCAFWIPVSSAGRAAACSGLAVACHSAFRFRFASPACPAFRLLFLPWVAKRSFQKREQQKCGADNSKLQLFS